MNYSAYFFDSNNALIKSGSMTYDSVTLKYTFTETENQIQKGDIGSQQICVIYPDAAFTRAQQGGFFTFLAANGNKLGLVIANNETRTIIDDDHPSGVAYLNCYFLTLNVPFYTRIAGRTAFALALINVTTGVITKSALAIYIVQNGTDNFDENTLSVSQYNDLLQAIADLQASVLSRISDLEDVHPSWWIYGTAVTGTGTAIAVPITETHLLTQEKDMYLNSDTWNVYVCTSVVGSTGYWDYVMNVRGATGLTGDKGVDLRIRGVWNKDTAYYNDAAYTDIVYYAGSSYYCKLSIATTDNSDPLTDTAHWGLHTKQGSTFRPRGEWSALGDYYNNENYIDVAIYQGDAFYCKVSITGNAGNQNPTLDTDTWQPYVEKGISFRYRSGWVATNDYVNDGDYIDVVVYLGKQYTCTESITGNALNDAPPDDTTHWNKSLDGTMQVALDTDDTVIAHTLENNQDKTFSAGNPTSVAITIPASADQGFHSGINFKSGATPPTVSFTNLSSFTLKIVKYGFTISSYSPTANRTINMIVFCDGINVCVYTVEVE